MNIIANLLRMTNDEYSLMVLNQYVYWCELNAINTRDLQKLVSSQFLYNWYVQEIEDLELVFFDKLGSKSDQLPVKEITALYLQTTVKIGEYYPPKHLLQKIRKAGLQVATKTIKYNLN